MGQRPLSDDSGRSGVGRAIGAMSAPLAFPQFRRVWLASLVSNFGLLIQGVGAAWAMTSTGASPAKVALVQSALMLPVALLAVPAGALADMYDRRKVALCALTLSLAAASGLTLCAIAGHLEPIVLLGFCFLAGSGTALFNPGWQASVSEQVPPKALPQAVALNGISYNMARSFGPAIGGVIVVAGGAVAAFAVNAFCCLPMMIVLMRWRRVVEAARLPPERLGRALVSGLRYAIHSPPVRTVLIRALIPAVAGSAVLALLPLVARDLLHGGAGLYGVLLGLFGLGAVAGAVIIGSVRHRYSEEAIVHVGSAMLALAIFAIGASGSLLLVVPAVLVAGGAWTALMTLFNVVIQLSVPRWVAARVVALYQATLAAGLAAGSYGWGSSTASIGLSLSLVLAALLLLLSLGFGLVLRMPRVEGAAGPETDAATEPEVKLKLTGRSGPVVVEIDYRVDPARARAFYRDMEALQRARKRNGAYGWTLSRDIAAPECWTERFHCPTWLDYLRQRNRATETERAVERAATAHQMPGEAIRVRRLLERPFGSVRWRDETPDLRGAVIPVGGPGSGGL